MYGVPADLPLALFVGRELNQICIGRFQIQLHFSGTGSINVEDSTWELRDGAGAVLDAHRPHAERETYRIHQILDVAVARFTIDPPRSFTLSFATGHTLTIHDDSVGYESFSIELEGEPRTWIVV